jgi:hypothetical protein
MGSGGLLTGIALAGLVVELALFYFLYTGHDWARLVLGLLSLGSPSSAGGPASTFAT